jgi:dipeptidyl aminopeptidase/acylaminoacyl peptidase
MVRGVPSRVWVFALSLVALFSVLLFAVQSSIAAQSGAGELRRPSREGAARPVVELPPMPPTTAPDVAPAPPAPRAADRDLPWTRLVYYGFTQGNWDVFIADDDGHNTKQLTTSRSAEISPDLRRGGDEIVLASNIDGDFELFVIDTAGKILRKLTNNDASDAQGVWSPDGHQIAFVSDRDGNPELYTMRADGTGVRRLTNSPGYDGDPTWSPDGTQLAFSSVRSGGYRIWKINADGTGAVQLSNQVGSVLPAWSPDGDRIAYSALPSNNHSFLELYIMRSDGSEQGSYWSTYGSDMQVRSWSPDGEKVAYTEVTYQIYNNTAYISSTHIRKLQLRTAEITGFASSAEFPFDPAWQSLDAEAPVVQLIGLGTHSPADFLLNWLGSDLGGSGFGDFDVQVRADAGEWTDLKMGTTSTSAVFAGGKAGQRVGVRLRARDGAWNRSPWVMSSTTIESWAPRTAVRRLPPAVRVGRSLGVGWGGDDPGGSGIVAYDVQYRLGGGGWQNWLSGTSARWEAFLPQDVGAAVGQPIAFRSRGFDRAGNVQAWPATPSAGSALAHWWVAGSVVDNSGVPVAEARVTAVASTTAPAASTVDGDYLVLGTDALGAPALTWAKPGYGGAPATPFSAADDNHAAVVLPPADDLLRNGTFEAGWPDAHWTQTGAPAPVVTTAARATGNGGLAWNAPGQYGPGRRLTRTTAASEDAPRIILLPDKTPVALWVTDNGRTKTLVITERDPDGNWFTANQIADLLDDRYEVVPDPQGNLHVAATTPTGILYTYRMAASGWSPPSRVPVSSDAREVHLAALSSDLVYGVWRNASNEVFSSEILDYGWTNAPTLLKPAGTGDVVSLGLVAAADRQLHAVWIERVDFTDVAFLVARTRPRGGPGGAPPHQQRLARTQDPSFEPLLITAQGEVHLFVHTGAYTVRDEILYFQRTRNGWQAPDVLMGGRAVSANLPVLSPSGQPRVLIYSEPDLYLMARQPDGSWTWELVDSSTTSWYGLALAVAEDDSTHMMWSEADTTSGNLGASLKQRVRLPDGTWRAVQPGPAIGTHYGEVDLALEPNGTPHVLWISWSDAADRWDADVAYAGAPTAAAEAVSSVTQTVTIPAGMSQPVLSFSYQSGGREGATGFDVVVDNVATPLPSHPYGLTHFWLDMTPYAGQTVPVTFRLRQAAGDPASWAALDDVSLGTAYADVWLAAGGGAALPGETAELVIRAGNRAGVAAEGVAVALTLPPELSFVSALPAPGAPLRWELGALAPGAEQTVVVTVQVSATAKPLATVSATAEATAANELETLNNSAAAVVALQRMLYLPGVATP